MRSSEKNRLLNESTQLWSVREIDSHKNDVDSLPDTDFERSLTTDTMLPNHLIAG